MRHRYSEQDDAANYGSGGDQETDDVHEAFCLCRRVPHKLGKSLANELRAEKSSHAVPAPWRIERSDVPPPMG